MWPSKINRVEQNANSLRTFSTSQGSAAQARVLKRRVGNEIRERKETNLIFKRSAFGIKVKQGIPADFFVLF
jgi:hypothetical protein